jgi:hypothetical protein
MGGLLNGIGGCRPQGRADLGAKLDLLRYQQKKPHPTIARGAGLLHNLFSPTPAIDDGRGEVVRSDRV